MEEDQKALPEGELPVRLPKPPKRGWKLLLALLVSGALFVAAFALGFLLQAKDRIPTAVADWFKKESEATEEKPEEKEDLPKSDSIDPPAEEKNDADTEETKLPEGEIPIRKESLPPEKSLQNRSAFATEGLRLEPPDPMQATGEDPLVLILCTHSGEGYVEGEYLLPPAGDAIYTLNPEQSVLAVAEALATSLNECGIKTLFCNTAHDSPTRIGAYARAAESISTLLAEFPGIQYVIDLHREEIFAPDGALIGCIAEQDGTTYAQISALVGSWDDRSEKDAWRENLALASELGNRLNAVCPNLFRLLTLENSPYNQTLAAHSLTLFVGAAGNSVKEAKASANLLAEVFAKYLLGN